MKNFLKKEKGISLITLVITVIVLLIVVNVTLYSVKDNLGVQKLKDMQSDIQNLRDKISQYYSQYGELPIVKSVVYTNIDNIDVLNEEERTSAFYVIDLSQLDNLTLAYGKDYQKIEENENIDINTLKDIYIINKTTHNIFFVRGIKYDNEVFYTDYTKDDIDKKQIPDTDVSDNWSPTYDETAIYKDKNEDIAYIPKGFRVSRNNGENLISAGLVVRGPDDSEFVWIPVDKKSLCVGSKNGKLIARKTQGQDDNGNDKYQGVLYNFSETDSKEMNNYGIGTNSNREPDRLDNDKELEYDPNQVTKNVQIEYDFMIESIIKYGGFYAARYQTKKELEGEKVVSKPLNEKLTEYKSDNWYELYSKEKEYSGENVQSSMIWGSQYDAMLNCIQLSKVNNQGNFNIKELDSLNKEWTLECISESNQYRIARINNGQREGITPWGNGYTLSSRMTLYIK